MWSAADAAAVVLKRVDTFKSVLPSKMFEAMALARPILLGVEGEAEALLREAGAGIPVEPENAQEFAAAVVKLADDRALATTLGNAGQRFVEQNFSRDRLARTYLEIMHEAARQAPGSRLKTLQTT